MPVRAVLNVAYALLVRDRDAKEREQFDNDLYGFTAINDRANRELRGTYGSGGSDPETDAAAAIGASGGDD